MKQTKPLTNRLAIVTPLRCDDEADFRLIGFPPAGSGPQFFRPWKVQLGSHYQLEAVNIAGQEARLQEVFATSMNQLVEEIAAALLASRTTDERPMVFFGHSFGALVAFNVCYALRKQDLPVVLCVSAHCGPMHKTPIGAVQQLPDDALIAELHKFEGLLTKILENEAYVKLILPIIRSDLTIDYHTEHHQVVPLTVPLLILAGQDDHVAPMALMKDWLRVSDAQSLMHTYVGGHFYILDKLGDVINSRDNFVNRHSGMNIAD